MSDKTKHEPFEWVSEVPKDCPFEQSSSLSKVVFTGRQSDYQIADTIYPSWADDDNCYTPYTDGITNGMRVSSGGSLKTGFETGHAVLKGDDPLNLVIENTSKAKKGYAAPYRGRYPCGSLVHNGIWYYGTYCLGPGAYHEHGGFKWGYPNLGPMPGFQISKDYGKTWEPSPLSATKPLFPEPREFLGPVKMGAPHFVDFGKNMMHSPDGKAYMVAQGAVENDPNPRPCIRHATPGSIEYLENHQCTERMHLELRPGEKESEYREIYEKAFAEVEGKSFDHGNLSWISADQVYLARVTPSVETINDINAYEFFAGHDEKGNAIWSNQFSKIKPLLDWNSNMGCVTATFVPGLNKYLMCVTDGWPTVAKMHSYILEADQITGPWKMVSYMKDFGEQAYFLNFPSKFISDDGLKLWLCYSANYGEWAEKLNFNPPGGRYGLSLHEVTLS